MSELLPILIDLLNKLDVFDKKALTHYMSLVIQSEIDSDEIDIICDLVLKRKAATDKKKNK